MLLWQTFPDRHVVKSLFKMTYYDMCLFQDEVVRMDCYFFIWQYFFPLRIIIPEVLLLAGIPHILYVCESVSVFWYEGTVILVVVEVTLMS